MSLEKKLTHRKTADENAGLTEMAQDTLFTGLSSFMINEQRMISEKTRPRKIKQAVAQHIQSALPQGYFARSQQTAIENAGFDIWQEYLAMSDEEKATLSQIPTHSLKDRVATAVQQYFERAQDAEHPTRVYSRFMAEISGRETSRPFWQKMTSAAAALALFATLGLAGCAPKVTDYNDGGAYPDPLPTMNMHVDAGTVYGFPDADADEPLPGGISGDGSGASEDLSLPATAPPDEPEHPDEDIAESDTVTTPAEGTSASTAPTAAPASCLTETVIQFGYNTPALTPESRAKVREYVRDAHANGFDKIYVTTFRSIESLDDGRNPQLDDDDYNVRLGWQTADTVAEAASEENEALGSSISVLKTTYGEGASQGPGLAENRIAVLSTAPLPDLDADPEAAARIRGYARGVIYSNCGSTSAASATAPEAMPEAGTPPADTSAPAPAAPAAPAATAHAPAAHAPAAAHPAAPAHAPSHPAVTPATHMGPANLSTAPDGHPVITAPNGAVIDYGTFGADHPAGPAYVLPEGAESAPSAPAAEPSTPTPSAEPAAPATEPEAALPAPAAPAAPAEEEPLAGEEIPASIVARTSALEEFVESMSGELHNLHSFMDKIEGECSPGGTGNTLCAVAEHDSYINRCGADGSPRTPSAPGELTVCHEALVNANAQYENIVLDINLISTNYQGLLSELEAAGMAPADVEGLEELGNAIRSLEAAVESSSGSDTSSSNAYTPPGSMYAALLAEYTSTASGRRTVAELRSEGLDDALALVPAMRGARSTIDAARREARRADAYAMYAGGASVRDIAAEHDVSTSTVYRDLKAYAETRPA
ncbi:helix-turn-helix domain-containing protein [Candidatus Woesearchaeota archaeon]|nr:helix-turn-helix domain-containing protein [Candidatus Woesearchaeota archaeon]